MNADEHGFINLSDPCPSALIYGLMFLLFHLFKQEIELLLRLRQIGF